MKPMTIILIGALIAIVGGIVGAIGTWMHNKSSSEKSTRIEQGVNKGVSIGETTNVEVQQLRKENGDLLTRSVELTQKLEAQSGTIDTLRRENIDLYSKLASSSLNIYNNLTGGDSYCHCFFIVSTYYAEKDTANLFFKLGDNNKNPLRNITARIFDLNSYNSKNSTPDDLYKNSINFATIDPGAAVGLPDKFHLDKKKGVNLNIFFSATNGIFTQSLRMRFVSGQWATATIVIRDGKNVFEEIDKNYPEKDKSKIFK